MNNISKQFYYKKNRLQQLKGFYYTVRYGSPSKAAVKMNLVQSSLTMQIQSLERDLNTTLFNKNRGNFVLTEDGEALYKIAVPLIQGIDNLYETFLEKSYEKKNNSITIAAHHIAISYLLPQFIKEFGNINPKVEIKLLNIPRDEAIKRLMEDDVDIVIYPIDEVPEECTFKPSFKYSPTLIMNSAHPLASKKNITLEDMGKYPLVRIDPGLITLPFFEETVKKYGIGSNISFENGNWEILKHFVKANIGMAMVSTICIDPNEKNIVAKSMKKYFPEMSYGIMIKKNTVPSDTVKSFINLLDKSFFANDL